MILKGYLTWTLSTQIRHVAKSLSAVQCFLKLGFLVKCLHGTTVVHMLYKTSFFIINNTTHYLYKGTHYSDTQSTKLLFS